jgi:hypothetical protein
VPDLWRRRDHTPDGDLYRKDLTKELRTTDSPRVLTPLDIPVPGHRFAESNDDWGEGDSYVPDNA